MYYVSNFIFDREKSIRYSRARLMSGKIDFSNPAKLSGSGGVFARAGFLLVLEKVPDSGRSQSRRQNPIQP